MESMAPQSRLVGLLVASFAAAASADEFRLIRFEGD
jgi:hypothetical protein